MPEARTQYCAMPVGRHRRNSPPSGWNRLRRGMSGAAGAVALIGLVGIGLDFAEAPPRSNPLASPFGFRLGRSPGPVQANAPSRPYGAPSAGGIPSIRP